MKKYIVELSIIVLGVTIALVLENLNDYLADKKKLETTLNSIASEIEQHEKTLSDCIQNQEIIIKKYFIEHDSTSVSFSKLVLPTSSKDLFISNNSV